MANTTNPAHGGYPDAITVSRIEAGITRGKLVAAIRALASDIQDCKSGEDTAAVPENLLADAAELIRVLTRLIPKRSVKELQDAFGSPGSWVYGTPIDDALKRLYESPKRTTPSMGEGQSV